VARERVPRETCILKRKTFEIRTIVVRLREKDGKPAVPACRTHALRAPAEARAPACTLPFIESLVQSLLDCRCAERRV